MSSCVFGNPSDCLFLCPFPVLRQAKKGNAMNNETKTNQQINLETEGYWPELRTRVRAVDFMRIEDTLNRQELSRFELEVKEKITSQKTPPSEMIQREADQARREMINYIYALAAKAGMTPAEKQCFRLLYVKNMSIREAGRKMDLPKTTVGDLNKKMISKMRDAVKQAFEKDGEFRKYFIYFPRYQNFLERHEIGK